MAYDLMGRLVSTSYPDAAGLDFPQLGREIVRTGGQELAVGTERDTPDCQRPGIPAGN